MEFPGLFVEEIPFLFEVIKMHKKTSTIIITVVCAIAIVAVTVGYMLKEGIINKDNLFMKNYVNRSNDVDSTKAEPDSVDTEDLLSNAFFREGAGCYLDCGLNIDEKCPIYFRFNSLNVSKELGDFDLCDDWDEIKDENGTITNEYSYISCNVTIINKGELNFETTLDNLWLYYGINSEYTEVRSYNSKRSDTFKKDYYYVTFEPDVEYNFNIAYIVKDDVIDKCKSEMLIFVTFVEPDWNTTYPVIEKQ